MADQPYVGALAIYPYNFEPLGWLRCDGQSLTISDYTTLFQLINTTYGGDGQSTFKIPDMRTSETDPQTGRRYHKGLENTSLSYCIAPYGVYPSQT